MEFRFVLNFLYKNISFFNNQFGLRTTTLFSSIQNNFMRYYSSYKRNKIPKVWVNFEVFVEEDLERFRDIIYNRPDLSTHTDYSVLIKMRKRTRYLTIAPRQQHIKWFSKNDHAFEKLFWDTVSFIDKVFEEYRELEDSCDSILYEFYPVSVPERLRIKNVEKIGESLGEHEMRRVLGSVSSFGLEIGKVSGGQLLDIEFNDQGMMVITSDELGRNESINKFVNEFNKQVQEGREKFLGLTKENVKGVYLIKKPRTNMEHIIICKDLEKGNVEEKLQYNITGTFISYVRDYYKVKIKDGESINYLYKRERGSVVEEFDENLTMVTHTRRMKFDSISPDWKSSEMTDIKDNWLVNPNIGTLDLETFTDEDSWAKPYAIGFFARKDPSPTLFYIDKSLNYMDLIHKCISEMLRDKYKDITFYVHNFGRFDSAFIIKYLLLFNETTEEGRINPYEIEPISRDNNIIRLVIKRIIDGKTRRVKILDSVAMVPSSLRELCEAYEVETPKGYFPYEFVNRNTLFYIGEMPDFSFYKDITKKEYRAMKKEIWSLKDEALEYLSKDLLALYEVMSKVNQGMFELFNIQMTDHLTISSYASTLFLTNYYQKDKAPLPLIKQKDVWEAVHSAYYGGRTEVYTPKIDKGTIVYHYDVNSLHPSAMLNPMPGLNWSYKEWISSPLVLTKNNIESHKDLFGFFYCKVNTAKEHYIGLLPNRDKDGQLKFHNGTWSAWYFSEEIKFAVLHGYEVEISKGYETDISYNSFDNYVNDVYKHKANPKNNVIKNIAKLILNSGIGRYGMDFMKPVTKLVTAEQNEFIFQTRVVKNSLQVDDNRYLVTFVPGVDREVCLEHGIDFAAVLNDESIDEKSERGRYKSISISTAAAILAYSRIHMAKLILDVLNRGGKIYYTDTDSIFTDLKLPEEMVGPELGKLKLEDTIKAGLFVADKTYYYETIESDVVKKAKGVNAKLLGVKDYKAMYQGKAVKGKKDSFKKDYEQGSVILSNELVKLHPASYRKRTKVLDSRGNWVSTQPLKIIASETTKSNMQQQQEQQLKEQQQEEQISTEGTAARNKTAPAVKRKKNRKKVKNNY